MVRRSYDEYRDRYLPKMSDIQVHNDFLTILDWVKDKPGYETDIMELASVLAGDEPATRAEVMRAVGASLVMTSWPGAIGTVFFEIRSENGDTHSIDRVPQDALDGKVAYVLEATGEVISDLPSRLIPRIRVDDFEPSSDAIPGMR